jgi:cell division septation protein DedD
MGTGGPGWRGASVVRHLGLASLAIIPATFLLSLVPTVPTGAVAAQLRIAVIGDYGCQPGTDCGSASSQQEVPVANMVHSWNPDAIFTVGDNSYETATAIDVPLDQKPYAADVQAGRFYWTPGNHDWLTNPDTPSTSYFARPNHYVAHLGGGLTDVFVTDMNGQDPDGDSATSKQAAQYRADVAASTAVWKITTDHQAFYSSGEHGTNTYTHWAILPAIDLFLSGHDHDFEHLVEGGKNFVVDGVGGKNLYVVCATGCIPGSLWHDDKHFGAVRLTITTNTLQVEYIALGGTVEHSFVLSKGPAPTVTATPTPAPTPKPTATPPPTATASPTHQATPTPSPSPTPHGNNAPTSPPPGSGPTSGGNAGQGPKPVGAPGSGPPAGPGPGGTAGATLQLNLAALGGGMLLPVVMVLLAGLFLWSALRLAYLVRNRRAGRAAQVEPPQPQTYRKAA